MTVFLKWCFPCLLKQNEEQDLPVHDGGHIPARAFCPCWVSVCHMPSNTAFFLLSYSVGTFLSFLFLAANLVVFVSFSIHSFSYLWLLNLLKNLLSTTVCQELFKRHLVWLANQFMPQLKVPCSHGAYILE